MANALFITVNAVVLAIVILRLYIWTKNLPKSYDPPSYHKNMAIQIAYLVMDTWATWVFWFFFAMTAFCFTFYKFESQAYVVMPDQSDSFDNDYMPFLQLFVAIFVIKMAAIAVTLYLQATRVDVFFIDWEEPQKQSYNQQLGDTNKSPNIWRTLLLANEYNELNDSRYLSIEWTVIIFASFMRLYSSYIFLL